LQAFRTSVRAEEEEGGTLVDKLFGIELENTVKNKELQDEPAQVSKEQVLKLSCHIDNNSKPVDQLSDGLKASLEGDIEKYSDLLGRNSVYTKQTKINKLVRPSTYHNNLLIAILLDHSIREILLEEGEHSLRHQSRQSQDSKSKNIYSLTDTFNRVLRSLRS
jgi:hypothetical protein